MLHVLILDGDKKECEWAKGMLLHYGSEHGKEIQVDMVSDEKNLMEYVCGDQEPDPTVNARNRGYIRVLAKGKVILVREEEIRYIERKGRSTHIVCHERNIEIREKLSELEKKLVSEAFVRCHNSFIVNLNSVLELKRTEILLEGGEIIPVSRYRLERTREQFLRWMGE